ncbi:MAG: ribosomal protein L13e [Candidatus Bathyarchaeia archaeon]
MRARSVVRKRNGRTRRGRGFSRGELREIELDFKQALKLGIPIDRRRKTKHEENIKILERYLRSQGSMEAG